jgi:hypothetical protein
MKYLSFNFYFKFGKYFLIISLFVVNLSLIIFNFYHYILNKNNNLEILCFSLLILLFDNIFEYYLLKSKTIKYNKELILIEYTSGDWIEIPITKIDKIKRTYFYFYNIHYKSFDGKNMKVIFFISPNPPFERFHKVKEVEAK